MSASGRRHRKIKFLQTIHLGGKTVTKRLATALVLGAAIFLSSCGGGGSGGEGGGTPAAGVWGTATWGNTTWGP